MDKYQTQTTLFVVEYFALRQHIQYPVVLLVFS